LQDIAKVAFALLREEGHQGKSYDIEALTMAEIAERISHAVGRSIRYVNVSPAERRQALLDAGAAVYMADALDEQAQERRRHPSRTLTFQRIRRSVFDRRRSTSSRADTLARSVVSLRRFATASTRVEPRAKSPNGSDNCAVPASAHRIAKR
jgi:hypothetical protein